MKASIRWHHNVLGVWILPALFVQLAGAVFGAACLSACSVPETDPQIIADCTELTSGVSFLDRSPGTSTGALVVHGRKVVPLVSDEENQIVVAAGRMGTGRAVAFSHSNFFRDDTLTNTSDLSIRRL